MSNSFADTFETPAVREHQGKEITIPRLTTRDYVQWCADLTEEVRKRDRALVPANAKPIDRFKIEQSIAANEVTPDDLRPELFKAKGVLRVLDIALSKAGIDDEATRNAIVDSAPHHQNQRDAAKVAALHTASELRNIFDPPKSPTEPASDKPVTFAGKQSPNEQTPAPSVAGSDPTGPLIASSSSSTPDAMLST